MSVCRSLQLHLSEEILGSLQLSFGCAQVSKGHMQVRFKLLTQGWRCCRRLWLHWPLVRCFCFEEDSENNCLPVNSQFEFTQAGSVLLTWIFLCACDKWLITKLITRKNWFWQGRSQNTLCLFPHGHAQMPPDAGRKSASFLASSRGSPKPVLEDDLIALKTRNSLLYHGAGDTESPFTISINAFFSLCCNTLINARKASKSALS